MFLVGTAAKELPVLNQSRTREWKNYSPAIQNKKRGSKAKKKRF